MSKSHLKWSVYIIALGISLWLSACAQINPLQGGEKDNYAPRIDSVGTYPLNGQTNFKGQSIQIKFSEYIALNKASENILITPQLPNKPTYRVKNKKFYIDFAEPLAPNTTYTISFNHAITDITEKNDSVFQYVFSTGDYIDSLSLIGSGRDAYTNKPTESYLVALFNAETSTQEDSIPYLDQPIYITQTNSGGQFRLDYLKGGSYYIYLIKDQNKNLKLDAGEAIGFLPGGPIEVGLNNPPLLILTFTEPSDELKILRTKFDYPGKLTFIFNQDPVHFDVKSTMELLKESTGNKDSLVYWLSENPTPKMEFIIEIEDEIDTIKPLYKGAPTGKGGVNFNFENNLVSGKLLPNDSLKLFVAEPILAVDKAGFHYYTKDSLELDAPEMIIQNVRTLCFLPSSQSIYYLKIDSGAVQSNFQHKNDKDEWISINFLEESYFGSLILNIDSTFEMPVIVQLLGSNNEVIREEPFAEQLIFDDLEPGKYQVRLILDENGDGLWTTGSLIEKRMPEKIIYNLELIDIKSNWEKEIDWLLNNQ